MTLAVLRSTGQVFYRMPPTGFVACFSHDETGCGFGEVYNRGKDYKIIPGVT